MILTKFLLFILSKYEILAPKKQTSFLEEDSKHSFILAISIAPLQVLYYSQAFPTTAWILYRSFTPKRRRNCIGKGLAQGHYVAARAGVELAALWLKVVDSTKAPPRPTRSPTRMTPVDSMTPMDSNFLFGHGFYTCPQAST